MKKNTMTFRFSIILILILLMSCRKPPYYKPIKTVLIVESITYESEIDGVSVYMVRAINDNFVDSEFPVIDSIYKYKSGDVIELNIKR